MLDFRKHFCSFFLFVMGANCYFFFPFDPFFFILFLPFHLSLLFPFSVFIYNQKRFLLIPKNKILISTKFYLMYWLGALTKHHKRRLEQEKFIISQIWKKSELGAGCWPSYWNWEGEPIPFLTHFCQLLAIFDIPWLVDTSLWSLPSSHDSSSVWHLSVKNSLLL